MTGCAFSSLAAPGDLTDRLIVVLILYYLAQIFMNNRVNILIVEDEAILAMALSDQLEEEGYCVVGVASNGRKALDLFRTNPVDLILCDITIKGDWDGIDTIAQLYAVRQVPVIYLTALADRATIQRAKATWPAAYITKPFDTGQLRLAIEMALNNSTGRGLTPELIMDNTTHEPMSPSPAEKNSRDAARTAPVLKVDDALFVKQNYQFVRVPLAEILFLEADNIHTAIVTQKRKYTVRLSLSHLLERLQSDRMVRTHRSYVVHLDRIDSFSEHEVMIGTHSIPLGRNFKDEFMQRFPVF